MKIFLVKTIIIFISVLVLYKMTIGSLFTKVQKQIDHQFSNEKIILLKDKIRDEIRGGLEKERILSEDDAEIIGRFFKKIVDEVNQAK